MKKLTRILSLAMVLAMASCVSLTVNVYFPATEIKQAAEEIEERVRSGQGAEGLENSSSMLEVNPRTYLTLSFDGYSAFAQELDINIKTPAIIKIIESRTKRYKETIEKYMDQGILGEGYDGYLALKEKEGLDLKALSAINKLIKEENNDRTLLYREILTANKVEVNEQNMQRVEQLFAAAIQEKMKPGHWYSVKKDPQSKETTWIQKKKKE